MKSVFRNISKKKAIRVAMLIICDICIVNISAFLSIFLRFEMNVANIPENFFNNFISTIPIVSVLAVFLFFVFGLYNSLWEFAGIKEVFRISVAVVTLCLMHFIIGAVFHFLMPKSCYFIELMIMAPLIIISRFCYRFIRALRHEYNTKTRGASANIKNIMVIGAGEAGSIIIRDIEKSGMFYTSRVACVIDDDLNKVGSSILGVKIVGTRNDIITAAQKFNIDEIIFAVPSINNEERAKIFSICRDTGCQLKTLPGLYQLLDSEFGVEALKNVEVEDLLFRDSIEIDLEGVMDYVKDKVVLVTGGGGSIGSELCRQISLCLPKQLIIFDICENGAYDIQMELNKSHPELNLVTLIGSVRDTKRINAVFEKYRPDVVYHAAAHKHVPLMEDSPNESVKNNIFGTLKTVQAADRFGVKRFVLISTDKAVNPTSIMGATKRVCEMIAQAYNARSKTEFVAVRFGNVLDSSGSVIPLFKKQIEYGGPVTVTHPDVIRYFITISEAVSLVLQAGAFANGGEIFALDMGRPVRIVELAENLIKLSGYTPYVDIDIEFVGLRPGEKLHEEMLMDEEMLVGTENKLIHIGKPIEFDEKALFESLSELYVQMMDDSVNIREMIMKIVST